MEVVCPNMCLGFTSLRQHYNDRREETGLETPCPNEPEFQAYMLIFDLCGKSTAIQTSELPSQILDHPVVKLAWEIRKAAQRNFDSQKEGSKHNAELGANLVTRFTRLLKQTNMPYLLSCLVEIRLRDLRRSTLRSMVKSYYPPKGGVIVKQNDQGEVVETRLIKWDLLDELLGCEVQEEEESAFDDVVPVIKTPDAEALNVVKNFELQCHPETGAPVGAIIHQAATFNGASPQGGN